MKLINHNSMVEGWDKWLEEVFQDTLRAMPTSIFSKFGSDKGVAILPDFEETMNSEETSLLFDIKSKL
jgi:hypothetical protein